MSIIEGIGDDVTVIMCLLLTITTIAVVWVSTWVTDRSLIHVVVYQTGNRNQAVTESTPNESQPSSDPNSNSTQTEDNINNTDLSPTIEDNTDHTDLASATSAVSNTSQKIAGNSTEEVDTATTNPDTLTEGTDECETETEKEENEFEEPSETVLRQRRLDYFKTCDRVPESESENQAKPLAETVQSSAIITKTKETLTDTPVSIEAISQTKTSQRPTNTLNSPQHTESRTAGLSTEPGNEAHEGNIRIRLKYLTDLERLVECNPETTVADFIRQHFATELSENKTVRLFFRGQEMKREFESLQTYEVIDNSVVHCMVRQIQANIPDEVTDETDLDLGRLMLPLFAFILGLLWYFRLVHKQFFNTMSTLVLAGITFLFGVIAMANVFQRLNGPTPGSGQDGGQISVTYRQGTPDQHQQVPHRD